MSAAARCASVVRDLGSELIRQVLGLDLDHRMGGAGADRLDAIAPDSRSTSPVTWPLRTTRLQRSTSRQQRARSEDDHALPPRHRTHLAGDGSAARQRDSRRRGSLFWAVDCWSQRRKRDANNRPDRPGRMPKVSPILSLLGAGPMARERAVWLAAISFAEQSPQWRRRPRSTRAPLQAVHPEHRSVPSVCDPGRILAWCPKGVTLVKQLWPHRLTGAFGLALVGEGSSLHSTTQCAEPLPVADAKRRRELTSPVTWPWSTRDAALFRWRRRQARQVRSTTPFAPLERNVK